MKKCVLCLHVNFMKVELEHADQVATVYIEADFDPSKVEKGQRIWNFLEKKAKSFLTENGIDPKKYQFEEAGRNHLFFEMVEKN